jgi:hypothetical protein
VSAASRRTARFSRATGPRSRDSFSRKVMSRLPCVSTCP